jgi:hypothetical protein
MQKGKKEKAIKILNFNLHQFFYLNSSHLLLCEKISNLSSFTNNRDDWLFFYINLLYLFKKEETLQTTRFLLNAEDQNRLELNLSEKEKLEFRDKVLFKKYSHNTFYNHRVKENDSTFFIKNFLYNKLTEFKPIFNFFVYNVDKNIKKFSRGKSGKYTFV